MKKTFAKKTLCFFLIILFSASLCIIKANAVQVAYYGSGNYIYNAPVEPLTGLKFYVDYSAISKYGSSPFSSIFNWNGNYAAHVASIAQYPASWSSYPSYFVIQLSPLLLDGILGDTYFYNASGTCINPYYTFPMDQTGLYKCSVGLNSNESSFYKAGFTFSECLNKTIQHEVGHIFLLKHPTTLYQSSVMNQDLPNGSWISTTVTNLDRENMAQKWGY